MSDINVQSFSGKVKVSNDLTVTTNVHADYFKGDGSLLTNLPSGSGGVWNTNSDNEIYFISSNVGISNADPGHNLSVGSNLYVDDDGSNVLVVTGNVKADYFVGDGSLLTGLSGSGGVWSTNAANEIYFINNNVGISNADPGHNLSVGSNLYVDDDGLDVLNITGNVNATYLKGDGSLLTNLPSGSGGVWSTNAENEIYFINNNVGISNADPGHNLSVGSNLFVDDDGINVLVVDGNVAAESMIIGGISIAPSYPLSSVTDTGNTTPHTIEFTNVTTGIVTTGNVVVAGNVTAGSFLGDGSGLTALNATNVTTGTLDAARIPDLDAAKITTGTLTAARIPDLDAAKITTGTLTAARIPTLNQSTTGSAATLTTPRTIGGVNFNGSADIVPTTFGAATFDTDTLVVDSANNRVGIGTATPQTNLHIESSGTTGLDIYGGDTNNPYIFIGEHVSNYSRKWGMKMNYYGNSNTEWFNMAVVDDNTEINALTIRRNANVGIGTQSPDYKLEVNGSFSATGPTTGAAHGSSSMLYLLNTPLIKEWQWTGSTNNTLRVTFSTSELPTNCKAIYADVFMPTSSNNDHVGHHLGKNVSQVSMWTGSRNRQPSLDFGNLAQQQVFLNMPGQSDGFEYYYGNWWNSCIIPLDTTNKLYHTVSGETGGTQSWVYMVVKGYFH